MVTETDHQLNILRQKASVKPTSGTGTNQPAATSTPQNASKKDQSWLQQADLDALDMFLDQLDETPAGGSGDSNHAVEKSSKPSKKTQAFTAVVHAPRAEAPMAGCFCSIMRPVI